MIKMAGLDDFELYCNNVTTEVDGKILVKNKYKIYKWSDEQTHTMLSLYIESCANVGPLKKFRSKKEMWISICNQCNQIHGTSTTPDQVEGRFKTVLKKTRAVIKNNRTSGSRRKSIPFASSMEKIINNDDSLFPQILLGPNEIIRKEDTSLSVENLPSTSAAAAATVPDENFQIPPLSSSVLDESITTGPSDLEEGPPARKKQKSLTEKMVDRLIADKNTRMEIRETNRERRHREKMEQLEKLGDRIIAAVSMFK